MTAVAARSGLGNLAFGNQSNAAGKHALSVSKSLAAATAHVRDHAADWRTFTRALIEQVAAEHCAPDWDGYGARPISAEAKQFAQAFVDLLPLHFPAPDPVPDQDGEMALSWDFGRGHVLNVSIDHAGRISFAALLGNGSKRHGVEKFEGRVPEVVRKALEDLRDCSVPR